MIKDKLTSLDFKKQLIKAKIKNKIYDKHTKLIHTKDNIKHNIEKGRACLDQKMCENKVIQKIKRSKVNKKIAQFGALTIFIAFALSGLFYYLMIFFYNSNYYITLGLIYYSLSWLLLIIGSYITGKSYLFKKIITMFCKSEEV